MSPLRLLPVSLRERLFFRCINPRQHYFKSWFNKAGLTWAPGVYMHNLVVGDVISGCIAATGFYEIELSRKISLLAKEGGLFIDVGANLGYFSLLWLAGHPESRVIAVEASPRNHKAITANIEANRFGSRFQLLPLAAGNRRGTIRFTPGPLEQTGWGGVTNSENDPDSLVVSMVRLDEVIPEQTIAVMKIDVEGADTWVIQGCEKLLRQGLIKRIFFEQHAERMAGLGIQEGEALAFLEKMDYTSRLIAPQEWEASYDSR